MLGLIPSSEIGWPAAVAALKPCGGWLHIHGNVVSEDEAAWRLATVRSIAALASGLDRDWDVQVCSCFHAWVVLCMLQSSYRQMLGLRRKRVKLVSFFRTLMGPLIPQPKHAAM